nr:MAG TPA: hypothetical protein [Caudoviricetes sp.]
MAVKASFKRTAKMFIFPNLLLPQSILYLFREGK